MLKIDIHTHILPPELPKFKDMFGYGGFLQMHDCKDCAGKDLLKDDGSFFRRVGENAYHPEARLQECDAHGVQVQVLSTIPVMFSYWAKPQDGLEVAKILNDHIADVAGENPRRFVGLGTLPMQAPELAVREAERGMSIGLHGFQIGSHIDGMNLDDPRLFPVYAACEEAGAVLFVHPWDMMGQDKMKKYWLPWLVGMPAEGSRAICSMIFGGVFEKFPRLRVAFAHGGGSFVFTLGRIKHGFDARPDLVAVDCQVSPEKYLGHFWVDSLVHDVDALRFLRNSVGADRICLGTDYPFPLGENVPGQLIHSLDATPAEKAAMLHGSALRWLGLEKKQFTGEA